MSFKDKKIKSCSDSKDNETTFQDKLEAVGKVGVKLAVRAVMDGVTGGAWEVVELAMLGQEIVETLDDIEMLTESVKEACGYDVYEQIKESQEQYLESKDEQKNELKLMKKSKCVIPQSLNPPKTQLWQNIRNIKSDRHLTLCLDGLFESNVHIDSQPDDQASQWMPIETQRPGVFVLENRANNTFLNVCGNSRSNGANVITYDCEHSSNSQWRIQKVGKEKWVIMNKHSKKFLNVMCGMKADLTNVHQWDNPTSGDSIWKFELVKNQKKKNVPREDLAEQVGKMGNEMIQGVFDFFD